MNTKRLLFFMVALMPQFLLASENHYIITAQRILKPIDKVSNSVTIISEQEIMTSGARDLTSLLQSKAGLYISSNGSIAGVATLRIRGGSQGFSKIIVDGIEMLDSSGVDNSFELNQIDISNIHSIEILKGAQSVIYGSEAMNGVLKINTKKTKQNETNLRLGYGSFNTSNYSFSHSGAAKDISYSLGTSLINSDGISSYNAKRTTLAEKDRYNRMNVNSVIDYQINKNYSLSYQLFYVKSDLDIDNFGSDQREKDNSSYDQNSHQIVLNSKHLQSQFESQLKLSTTEIYRNSEISSTNSTARDYTISWLGTYFHSRYLSHIIGLDHKNYSSKQKYDGANIQKRTTEVNSAFLQSHISYSKVFADLGLRVNKQDGQDSFLNYKSGVGVNLTSQLSLKGTYATAFKSPTLYQLSTNQELKSTESDSMDLTLIYNKGGNSIELAYFDYDYTNQISYNSTDSKYENKTRTRIDGYELSISNQLTQNLSLRNSFTLTYSQDKETKEVLLKTPKKLWSSQLEYNFNENLKNLTQLQYVGERFEYGQVRMASYLILNSSWTYKSLQFTINNLLDKEYEDTNTYATPDRNYRLSYTLEL